MTYIKICELSQKQYLILIRCLICVCDKLNRCLRFAISDDCVCEHVYLKNDMFKTCFWQNAKCKITAQTGRHITYIMFFLFFAKSALYMLLYNKNVAFLSADRFFVFSVSLIISCIHNLSNIYSNISPISQIYYIHSIHSIQFVIRSHI